MRLNTLNCSSCRQLYYALIRASGDGPLQQCRCFSFLHKSKRWCTLVLFIATSLHISVALCTLDQYILQQDYYSIRCWSYSCGYHAGGEKTHLGCCYPLHNTSGSGQLTTWQFKGLCYNSTHSGQWNCFGLPMVGRAHVKRSEEG